MVDADTALEILKLGNERFVTRVGATNESESEGPPVELPGEQAPFAVVLACSDSRVPVETVFDQGLGDLFVIRSAGHVVSTVQLGSVEFGVGQLGARLLLVLGHSKCGAVSAAIDDLNGPPLDLPPNLRSVVELVRPAVEPVVEAADGEDRSTVVGEAVDANVRATIEALRSGSELLGDMHREGELEIVGARYDLDTGWVTFLPLDQDL